MKLMLYLEDFKLLWHRNS